MKKKKMGGLSYRIVMGGGIVRYRDGYAGAGPADGATRKKPNSH